MADVKRFWPFFDEICLDKEIIVDTLSKRMQIQTFLIKDLLNNVSNWKQFLLLLADFKNFVKINTFILLTLLTFEA